MRLRPLRLVPRQAFTMVELAISIAVIGFALVAIIGLLPAGLRVSQENREDTLINQEGAYLLETLRNGSQGMLDLPGFLERLDDTNYYGVDGQLQRPLPDSRTLVGLLSQTGFVHTAVFRTLSGPAANQEANGRDLAFRYHATFDVAPVDYAGPEDTNTQAQAEANLFEVRLTLRWPVNPANNDLTAAIPNRQRFRTTVSGTLEDENGLMWIRGNTFRNAR